MTLSFALSFQDGRNLHADFGAQVGLKLGGFFEQPPSSSASAPPFASIPAQLEIFEASTPSLPVPEASGKI
jgi:hypothetical protein